MGYRRSWLRPFLVALKEQNNSCLISILRKQIALSGQRRRLNSTQVQRVRHGAFACVVVSTNGNMRVTSLTGRYQLDQRVGRGIATPAITHTLHTLTLGQRPTPPLCREQRRFAVASQ